MQTDTEVQKGLELHSQYSSLRREKSLTFTKKSHKYYLQNPLAFLQDKESGCECDQTLFR